MLMPRDAGRDEAQKLHRKWMKHQAFMAELAHNKEWLAKIEQEGEELIQEQPELRPVVQQKLKEMRECWTHLESTTKAKARQLFETQNHRTADVPQTLSDLDQHLNVLHEQPPPLGTATNTSHITPTSLLPPRATFSQQLQRIQVWIQERLPLAPLKNMGTNLQSVQHLVKNHEALQMEQQARRARLEEVLERAEAIAALRTPEVELVREGGGACEAAVGGASGRDGAAHRDAGCCKPLPAVLHRGSEGRVVARRPETSRSQ
ncbi:hypothetical protein SRHO_G00285400 [Serrasalmus rhombeus]